MQCACNRLISYICNVPMNWGSLSERSLHCKHILLINCKVANLKKFYKLFEQVYGNTWLIVVFEILCHRQLALDFQNCYKYHTSGPISQDEDGLDEQCRWCSEGGKLFGCDFCHNAFCKTCIIRNLGRSEISNVTEDGIKEFFRSLKSQVMFFPFCNFLKYICIVYNSYMIYMFCL